MRATMGDAWFAELIATLDDGRDARPPPGTRASRASGASWPGRDGEVRRPQLAAPGPRAARRAARRRARPGLENAVATWEREGPDHGRRGGHAARSDRGADLPGDAALPGRALPDQHPAPLPLRQHRPPDHGGRRAGCGDGSAASAARSTATPWRCRLEHPLAAGDDPVGASRASAPSPTWPRSRSAPTASCCGL